MIRAMPEPTTASTPFPDFAVACGEEGSDPLVVHDGGVVRVDELAASGHLVRMEDDLADVASLGVGIWRYGMPWRLTEPEPGRYDWSAWDRALGACEDAGLTPVVDLCHFGLPDHYRGFCDRSWVHGFNRYVEAFLARYPEPHWFTPVNEPGITAVMSALLGAWNDTRASELDYVTALANVTLANLEAMSRICSDRDGWWIGSEGFGCSLVDDDDDEALVEALHTQALQQLVWDLHFGVDPPDQVSDLVGHIDDAVRARIGELAAGLPVDRVVAGHDLYPLSIVAYGRRSRRPITIADRVAAYEATAKDWHERYRRPFWVAETSNLGLDVDEGIGWLDSLVAGIDRLRGESLPARGICWYSRGDQYDWDSALTEPVGRVTTVGLFDEHRVKRPVADAFARLADERR